MSDTPLTLAQTAQQLRDRDPNITEASLAQAHGVDLDELTAAGDRMQQRIDANFLEMYPTPEMRADFEARHAGPPLSRDERRAGARKRKRQRREYNRQAYLRSQGIDLSEPRSSLYKNYLQGQGIDVPLLSEGPAQQELFSPGERGGAQGPEDLQARGSTRAPDDLPPASTPFPERSPGSLTAERNAAAARALQADRARRSARLSAVGRGAGALAVGADAALLGYNTVQQGDPLRGAMETGAQTVEGVGSILRAPQAGLEMAGINPPPWANPLQQISEAGDMLTETMGPYRRWQEREARIRENTPDRVTQQRESRNAAVSRALAPKE